MYSWKKARSRWYLNAPLVGGNLSLSSCFLVNNEYLLEFSSLDSPNFLLASFTDLYKYPLQIKLSMAVFSLGDSWNHPLLAKENAETKIPSISNQTFQLYQSQ